MRTITMEMLEQNNATDDMLEQFPALLGDAWTPNAQRVVEILSLGDGTGDTWMEFGELIAIFCENDIARKFNCAVDAAWTEYWNSCAPEHETAAQVRVEQCEIVARQRVAQKIAQAFMAAWSTVE